MLFAIPNFSFWYFLRHPDIKKQKLHCQRVGKIKKILIIILKGLYKTTFHKTKSNLFSQFFFSHWQLHEFFFLFFYQSVCKFLKLYKILLASFHCVKKWRKFENTDRNILPKTNVILTFLNNLKPKFFFVGQLWWPT